jgi:shikimate kinase
MPCEGSELRDDVVLIGPPQVGKTTVAALLAGHLGVEHHEFDDLRRAFYEELGFDMELNLALNASQGWAGMYAYWKVFDPHALERFFASCHGVLDVGGGTPVAEHPSTRARIATAFAPFRHVVLLVPDPDLERSMEILAGRTPDEPGMADNQRYLLEQGSLQALATHVVYTGERRPPEVFEEVVAVVER